MAYFEQEPAKSVTFEIESQKSKVTVTLKSHYKVKSQSHESFALSEVTAIKVTMRNKSHKVESFFIKSHAFQENFHTTVWVYLKV